MLRTYLLFSCLVSVACGSELATWQTQTSSPSQPSQISDQHDNSEATQVQPASYPGYPPNLRDKRAEGDVEILVFIEAIGRVSSVKLLKESPYPEFNEFARRAALDQQWTPATRDGKPTSSTKKYSYRFRLTDDPAAERERHNQAR